VSIHNGVPVLLSHSLDKPVAATTSTCDEDVETAEFSSCLPDRILEVRKTGYVSNMGDSSAAICTNSGDNFFKWLSGSTHDNHAGTLGCQAARRSRTYSTAATGNESG
jgi:hypothetical protein